jgi:hypothetical protein
MKKVKSTKTLMSFADSSMNLSEMRKVQGGIKLCRDAIGTVYPCGQLH